MKANNCFCVMYLKRNANCYWWFAKIIFEILFTLFHKVLTKYFIELQLKSTSQQSQFFKRINCQNVNIIYKSRQCVNEKVFIFNIALIITSVNLFKNGLWASWASVLGLLTELVTVTGWM